MPESVVVAMLRNHFAQEASAGFPTLLKIPQTGIFKFLDYFGTLDPAGRDALLDALALRGETHFFPGRDKRFPSAPAFDGYWEAITSYGPFFGGYRYTAVKMMSAMAKCGERGGLPGIAANAFGLALEPRSDFLPDVNDIRPAPASLLRKLVDAAVNRHGFARDRASKRGELKYDSPSGASVRFDFGSYLGQLSYAISVARDHARLLRVSHELLWGQPGGWDYLTEANAEQAIARLPEMIETVARLIDQTNGIGV